MQQKLGEHLDQAGIPKIFSKAFRIQTVLQVADYNRIVERVVVVAVEVAVAQDLWMVVLLAVLLVAVAGTSKPNIVDTASKLLVVLPSQQESAKHKKQCFCS